MGGFRWAVCHSSSAIFHQTPQQRASVVVVVHVVKHEPKRSPIRVGLVRFNVIEVDFNPGVGALQPADNVAGLFEGLASMMRHERFGRIFFFRLGRPAGSKRAARADVDLLQKLCRGPRQMIAGIPRRHRQAAGTVSSCENVLALRIRHCAVFSRTRTTLTYGRASPVRASNTVHAPP